MPSPSPSPPPSPAFLPLQEAKKGTANVFATDTVLAMLMTATRSVYSWDILIHKEGNKIYFDKRDSGTYDLLSVDETAFQPPSAEDGDIDSPHYLAVEATRINQAFTQQVLKVRWGSGQGLLLFLSAYFISLDGQAFQVETAQPFFGG